jgi:hypothetical protein
MSEASNSSEYVNVPTQAPVGGATSPLNGEFYKGGQFMCNQWAMPKGYKKHLKRAAEKRTNKTRNIAAVTVTSGQVLIRMAGESAKACVFNGTNDQCAEFARQLIAAKAAQDERQGFRVHPTELVIEGQIMKTDVDERDFEQEAIEEATAIAERDGIVMVVVYAPIENAEDESPWGFCPKGAEQILYRWGDVRHIIGEPIKRRR